MIKGILAFFLIIVLLCSCTSQPFIIESNIESLPSSTPSVSLPATSPLLEIAHDVVILPVSPAAESIEAYKKVLNNEIDFFDTYLQRNISLQDYCIEECTVDDFKVYFMFSIVDLDGDDVPEVVLYVGPPGINLVFHYENGKVYGQSFGVPETTDIRTNGLFELTNQVYWALCKLEFSEKSYNYIKIALSDSNNDLGETVFYLNDTEVTEAEFNDFVSNSDYWKTDLASWYEFNEENIDKYLIWNVPPQEIKDEQPKTENISQNNDNVPQQGENNDFELTVSACYTKALQEFMNNAVGKTYSILFDLDGDGTEEMIALDEGIAEPETEHWGAYAIGMRIAVFNVKDGECTAEYIESLAITHSTYMVYISSRNDIVIYDTFEGTMYRVYSYKNGLLTKEAELVDGCYANSIYYSIDGIECGEAQYDDKLKELNVNDNDVALGIGDLLYFWHKNEEIPLRDDTLKILASENDS